MGICGHVSGDQFVPLLHDVSLSPSLAIAYSRLGGAPSQHTAPLLYTGRPKTTENLCGARRSVVGHKVCTEHLGCNAGSEGFGLLQKYRVCHNSTGQYGISPW